MLPPLLKSIQSWYRAIAPALAADNPDLTREHIGSVLQLLGLSALVFPLCIQRRLLPLHTMLRLRALPPAQQFPEICHQFETLNQQYGLDFPLDGVPPKVQLKPVWLETLDASVGNRPVSIDLLGNFYELSLEYDLGGRHRRKQGGSYYTPAVLVQAMTRQTLEHLPQHSLTLLDPACGGGAFLLTAFEQLLSRLPNDTWDARSHLLQHTLFGIDADPWAIALTRLSLLLRLFDAPDLPPTNFHLPDLRQTIRLGNSLVDASLNPSPTLGGQDWRNTFTDVFAAGGFDAVIGNPPYLDAEAMTRYGPELRHYCNQHFRTATGNWDLYCVFIERALTWCKPGGWHGFVVPNKLMSANYAATVRSLLANENQLVYLRDYSQVSVFSAAVYPITYLVQRATPTSSTVLYYERMGSLEHPNYQGWLDVAPFQRGDRPWTVSAERHHQNLFAYLEESTPLSHWATLSDAATVGEAYHLRPWIREQEGDLRGIPLVNSGTLDRYQILWGQKPLRYLGQTYQRPIIPAQYLYHLPARRLYQARQPKILVANMTRQIEAVLDCTGDILAGKSTTVILPRINPLWLVGILNSRLIQVWFSQTFVGNRLQGGYLRIAPPQLRQVPIRLPFGDQQDQLTMLVRQRIRLSQEAPSADRQSQLTTLEDRIDHLIYEIYGLSPQDIANLEGHSDRPTPTVALV